VTSQVEERHLFVVYHDLQNLHRMSNTHKALTKNSSHQGWRALELLITTTLLHHSNSRPKQADKSERGADTPCSLEKYTWKRYNSVNQVKSRIVGPL